MPPPKFFLFLLCASLMPLPAELVQTIAFDLIEEQPINISVGSITKILETDQNKTKELVDSMRFSFLPQGYPHTSKFRITDKAGEIFATERIDREELCGFSIECVLDLEVVAQSASFQFFRKIRVEIRVLDINDNPPKFPSKSVSLEISESVSVNSTFAVEGAIDPDTGLNSLQTYDILRSDGMFDLDIKKNLDGGSVVNLVIKQPLDREQRDFYRLYLMAKDGGIPRKSSLLMINITVTDVNDNAPAFPIQTYKANVKEVVPVGHVVLSVTATDADSKDNWRPFYRLSALQAGEARKFFYMNPRTGEISVISSLVKIQGRTMKFVIECVDGDTPPLVGQSEVEIFIQDTVNTPSVINLNLLNDGVVSESFKLGTVVAHLAVIDPDSGRNGVVKCSITSSTFEMQPLDVNEYKIILKRFVDGDVEKQVEGHILCRDEGKPALNITKNFTMTVSDENDNAPSFTLIKYEVTVEENNEPNTILVQVKATDSDKGKNGHVSYSIVEGQDLGVNISETGEIIALTSFDREENSEIVLKVMAKDGGFPSHNTTTTVTIYVIDTNDCPPTFTQTIYSFETEENLRGRSSIGHLEVYDLDEGKNSEVFLNIELMFEDVEKFPIVVSQNGELTTTRPLDREFENHFEFVVVAVDKGNTALTSTAKVFIDVTDSNDNAPEILYPVENNDTIFISHTVSTDTPLAYIEAVDQDYGNNSYLEYVLDSVFVVPNIDMYEAEGVLRDFPYNAVEGVFQLDLHTGELTLARSLTEDDVGVYMLYLTVNDMGLPSLSTNTTLNVEVFASNETIFALLTSFEKGSKNTTIVTALGCLTGIVIIVVIVIISTVRIIDRERTLALRRQRQLHIKVEPRENDITYEGEITMIGSKTKKQPLSSPKLTSHVSHGWKFLSNWNAGDKVTSNSNWNKNKMRKDSDGSASIGSDSGKGGSDDDYHSNETTSLHGNGCEQTFKPVEADSPPEPEYSVVMKAKDRYDTLQSRRLLPTLDEISLPSDDLYADYCSLDTIKEEPESPFKEAEFRFEAPAPAPPPAPAPVPKLRQPKKMPRTCIKTEKETESRTLVKRPRTSLTKEKETKPVVKIPRSAFKNVSGLDCQTLMKTKSRHDLRRCSDSSEEETLKRASVDGVSLKCGDSVIFDLDLQKVDDIYV